MLLMVIIRQESSVLHSSGFHSNTPAQLRTAILPELFYTLLSKRDLVHNLSKILEMIVIYILF